MKKYIEPITAIENALTTDLFMTTATNGQGEQIGDEVGPGTGDGDAKEREEFEEFVEFMQSQEETTNNSLW